MLSVTVQFQFTRGNDTAVLGQEVSYAQTNLGRINANGTTAMRVMLH
ncbi:hypothetical protein KHA80_11725 [Anaerobacillus sp. HL2]|nr:hypothetical protein KHA80_11725 [Anaerobacillus sp. HL2]